MRISNIFVLMGIVISSAVPALAFYPSGTINRDLAYDNIRIIQQPHHLSVTGTLINQTSRRIKVKGVIRFCTIHKEVLNSATINAILPPNGSVQFDRRLANDDYQKIQHAFTIEWDIQDVSRAAKHHRAHSNRRPEKAVGYGSTRISDSSVQVFGSGDHDSAESPAQDTAANMPAGEGSTGFVMIRLKNGSTIKADSCWMVGDKIHVSLYGGIMIVDQKDVREIIRSEASKAQK